MANYDESDIIGWFSLKGGKRIPIHKGESKQDAVSKALGKSTGTKQESAKSKESTSTSSQKDKAKSIETTSKDKQIANAQKNIDKLNAESAYRDSLKQGHKVTAKNGKTYFNGKEVDQLETSNKGTEDSLAKHVTKDGQLTPERAEVHRKIMQDYFDGKVENADHPRPHQPYAPGDEKVAMFTGGGGASGKGTFSKYDDKTGESNIGKYYSQDKNPLVVDPDAIKRQLAKADGRELDDQLTGYYHEESSSLAKQIYSTALQNNYPVMYDGTATGGGIYKLKASAESAGYKTEMCFVYSDLKTVRANSLARYEKTDRLVPAEQLMGAHQKAYGAVTKLQDQFDSFKLYDNAGRELKLVGSQTGRKKLSISNTESWSRFSKSAEEFTLTPEFMTSYAKEIAAINARKGR